MSKRSIHFSNEAWDDYQFWVKIDKKMIGKINQLLSEVQRTPFEGTGKPEPLRDNYSGYWSRRIDKQNRLVYAVDVNEVKIMSCRRHYS